MLHSTRILIPLLIICLLLTACGSSNSENNSYQPNTTNAGSNSNAASTHSNPSAAATSSYPPSTTSTANSDPYPPSGTLALDDPLSINRGYRWQAFPPNSGGASCQFIGGAYHAVESQHVYRACHVSLQASNFTLEVKMQVIQGNCGGLVLRDVTGLAHAYAFDVCQNGSYAFSRFDGFSASPVTLTSRTSGAIHTGLNQPNVIAAVASGSTFDLYINHQEIDTVTDNTYAQGQFGFSADGNTEAVYTNARMWTL